MAVSNFTKHDTDVMFVSVNLSLIIHFILIICLFVYTNNIENFRVYFFLIIVVSCVVTGPCLFVLLLPLLYLLSYIINTCANCYNNRHITVNRETTNLNTLPPAYTTACINKDNVDNPPSYISLYNNKGIALHA